MSTLLQKHVATIRKTAAASKKTMTATVLACSLALSGCSTSVDEYKDAGPNFELDQYFNGEVVAWGMVQDYSDKVVRRFCVEMTGTWQDKDDQGNINGVLDEMFYYADGEVDQRIWSLTKTPAGKYTGTAADVDGIASGSASGFGFQWQYTLNLALDGTDYQFFLDDWMYQLDDYRMMNRSYMKKFGVTVAEITIFFDKQQPLRSCEKPT